MALEFGEKLGKVFGDETLGTVSRQEPPKPAKKPKVVSKAPQPSVPPAPVTKPPAVHKTVSIKDQLTDMFGDEPISTKTGNHAILDVLNIPRTRLPVLTEHDKFIKETVFAISAPSGFDVDAVSNYCDKVEWIFEELTQLFREKEKDFTKLLEETARLEESIIKKAQQSEMAAFQMSRTKEDELQEKLIEAHETISKLREERDAIKNELLQIKSSERLKASQPTSTMPPVQSTSDIKTRIPPRQAPAFKTTDVAKMMADLEIGDNDE
jgi:hypothetical protein